MSAQAEWVLAQPATSTVRTLTAALACPSPVAAYLINRGFADPASAERYLEPSIEDLHDPWTLPDADIAVERLRQALSLGQSIAVFADRDIDGVAGAVLLMTLLENWYPSIEAYIPGKYEGYGLADNHVDEMADDEVDLLLTVDTGTTAHDALTRATDVGIDAIVLDHHTPEEELPAVSAVVNPRRGDSTYPNEALAGGAVAFKIGQGLIEMKGEPSQEIYFSYGLPLAALATVGDYSELTLENRAIVREGFDRLDQCDLPGLIEATTHVGVESIRDLGWSLIPLLNAAQEDTDGMFMLNVILGTDGIEAAIEQLETYRDQRRADRAEQRAHLQACFEDQIDPDEADLFFIETERYVGGGARRDLSETWGRPVVTYRWRGDAFQGGGRAAMDVDFIELFEACTDHLEDFWGHPGAAGFRVAKSDLGAFLEAMREAFRQRYEPEDLRPTLEIDTRLDPGEIDRDLVDAIENLRPFGNGNPEPVFLLESIAITGGRSFGEDDDHYNLEPASNMFSAVAWNGADEFDEINFPKTLDLAGTLGWDDFNDLPQLAIEDWRQSQEEAR